MRDFIAIQSLAYRYAHAADRRDYAAFDEIFTENAVLAMPDTEIPGRVAIVQAMGSLEQSKRTLHLVHNITVEVDGDTASAEVYCVAAHIYDGEDGERKQDWGIRYLDSLIRAGEGWRPSVQCLNTDLMPDPRRRGVALYTARTDPGMGPGSATEKRLAAYGDENLSTSAARMSATPSIFLYRTAVTSVVVKGLKFSGNSSVLMVMRIQLSNSASVASLKGELAEPGTWIRNSLPPSTVKILTNAPMIRILKQLRMTLGQMTGGAATETSLTGMILRSDTLGQ